ncbi:hypothetical protein [Methylobacterium oryzisoli]
MTTRPKQHPLLAITYPVALLTGALVVGSWLLSGATEAEAVAVADLGEP